MKRILLAGLCLTGVMLIASGGSALLFSVLGLYPPCYPADLSVTLLLFLALCKALQWQPIRALYTALK